ncbi:hypothetical protein RRG08_018189 [Elysia crispata]|uniref:Uncharacterized protein n=1 Tax=Elysia crispata TaxID=231223 RepID=A0AAE1DPL8_9GAST|nr:hypothetical protein RRG08_018189 [Elysia crispata]
MEQIKHPQPHNKRRNIRQALFVKQKHEGNDLRRMDSLTDKSRYSCKSLPSWMRSIENKHVHSASLRVNVTESMSTRQQDVSISVPDHAVTQCQSTQESPTLISHTSCLPGNH